MQCEVKYGNRILGNHDDLFNAIAMTGTQLRISQTIGHFYDDTVIMGPGGQEYRKVIEKMDEETKTDMVCKLISLGILYIVSYLDIG